MLAPRCLSRLLCVAVVAACSEGAGPKPLTKPVTWTSLTAGQFHTCGLTSSGAAYCWGANFSGQLGNASRDTISNAPAHSAPVAVAGGLTFTNLTAGGSHTCGLTSAGVAYCWGDPSFGELGDSSTAYVGLFSAGVRTMPAAVAGGLAFARRTAGGSHTCGLTGAGAAYCWGLNSSGELGTVAAIEQCPGPGGGGWISYPTFVPCSGVPVAVAGGLTFMSLSAGYEYTCGLTSAGAEYCWGKNASGELGDGSTTYRTTPTLVAGGLTFASLVAGEGRTCSVTSNGDAYCWGDNQLGLLGDGSTTQRLTPAAVAGGLTFASLVAGEGYTCGVASSGAAYCWGGNMYGALGDGSTTDRTTPVAVANP